MASLNPLVYCVNMIIYRLIFLSFFVLSSFFCLGQNQTALENKIQSFNIQLENGNYHEAKKVGVELIKIYKKTEILNFDDLNIIYKVAWLFLDSKNFDSYLEISEFGFKRSKEVFGESSNISIQFLKNICRGHSILKNHISCILTCEKILELQGKDFDEDNFFIVYAIQSFIQLEQEEKADHYSIIWLKRYQASHEIKNPAILETITGYLKSRKFYQLDFQTCLWSNSILINSLRGKNENCKLSKAYVDQAKYFINLFDLKLAKSYIDSSQMILPESCNTELELLSVKSEYFNETNDADSSLLALRSLISKVESGEEYYQNVVDLNSKLIMNLIAFGRYFEAQKEIDQLLLKIDITDPNFSLILAQKCDLNNRRGNFSESINLLLEHLSQSQINIDALDLLHSVLGNSYSLAGRFNESNEYSMPLIQKMDTTSVTWTDVTNSDAIPLVAMNLLGMNDPQGVIDLYNQYKKFLYQNKLYDPLVRLSLYASYAYQNIDDKEKSLSLLDSAMSILNKYAHEQALYFGVLMAYSNYYLHIKKYEECLKINDELISHYSKTNELIFGFVLFNSSICHLKLQDYQKSKSLISKGVQLLTDNYLENSFKFSNESRIAFKTMLEEYWMLSAAITKETNDLPDFLSQFWFNFNGFGNLRNNNFQDSLIGIKKLLQQEYNSLIETNSFSKSRIDFLKREIDKLDGFLVSSSQKDVEIRITDTLIKKVLTGDDVYVDISYLKMNNLEFEFDQSRLDSLDYLVFMLSKEKDNVDYIFIDTQFELDLIQDYKTEASDKSKATDLKNEIFYNSFWKPIADKIGDAKTVYVSLGGVYNNINLNTLYNPETGKYLIEEKDIHIVNSARDFVLMKEREKKQYTSTTSALYGFPDYNGNTTSSADTTDYLAATRDLDPIWIDSLTRGGMKASALPATKVEVEQIAGTFQKNGWKVSTHTGLEASETNIKKEDSPRVLHVATHGYFFEDIPMDKNDDRFLGMDRQRVVQDPMLRSGLLFTGANKTLQGEEPKGENGLLSAAEASLLNLRETELVVLSACETGKGEIKNSEGVYGLRKAFSDAGAQNIIMSLWKVDDKVTQEFMTRFYEIWLNEKTSIREAFNRTQLEIKAKYPQPYYWGAFILVGE